MDHDAIAQQIDTEPETRQKLEIWTKHYDLLQCNGRIYTKDLNGNELTKIYCGCANCKKEPQNAIYNELFKEFYFRAFDELETQLANEENYVEKLKLWVNRFGIDYCVLYIDSERNKELSIVPDPNSPYEVFTYNKMQYNLWKEHYFGPTSKSPLSSTDLYSRIKTYDEQLRRSPFTDKILEDNKNQLLEKYSKKANPAVKAFFNNLILGKPLSFEEKILDITEIIYYIEANEAYLFYCYLHNYNMTIKNVFLNHSAEIIAETDNGMTWGEIAKFFTIKAVVHNVDIPHTDKNFMNLTDSQGKKIPNKRAAFVANLKAFNAQQQFQIINELCDNNPTIPGIMDLKKQLIVDYKDLRQNSPLDESRKMIEEVKGLLSDYPRAEISYNSAVEKFEKGIYERNALDDLRLCLELLIKEILSNERSLENQREDLGRYFAQKGIVKEMANLIWGNIDSITKYQNKYVKHNDNIGRIDSQMLFDMTTTLLKQIIRASSMS